MGNNSVYIAELEAYYVTGCRVVKEINTHGRAEVKGYLLYGFGKGAKAALHGLESFTLRAVDDADRDDIVFVGMIDTYEVKHVNGYDELSLTLISETKKMDLHECCRVFQNVEETYEHIINYVSSAAAAAVVNHSECTGPAGHMSVQYLETDWSYLKRLASEKNSFLVPEFQAPGLIYYVGLPDEPCISFKDTAFTKKSNILEYRRKMENSVSTVLEAENSYIIETRKNYKIGMAADIESQGKTVSDLYLYKIESRMNGAVLVSNCFMKKKEGLKTIPVKNYNIIGASVGSVVNAVAGDKVKVTMLMDGIQGAGRKFEFATVYSSNDETGWYCMPEIGDCVRVYFPNEVEEEAFVFNAMQVDKAGKNPAVKFFRNPQGKEIEFGVDYLKITNNDGLSIKLDDKSGISITSKKDIQLHTGKEMLVESAGGVIDVKASDNVKLHQNKSEIVVDKDVTISGNQVHVQHAD